MSELWTSLDSSAAWIMVVGGMVNVACAVVGCFLVLRRMSLMGDALSHAVLPGLVLAFLVSGSLSIGPLFVGAILVGLLTTFLTETLHRVGGIAADASMGVVFTSLFALGVILIKRYLTGVHFDIDCVWEGTLLHLAFHTIDVGGIEIPKHITTIGPVLIANVLLITLLWKEFKISAFDPALATTAGFSSVICHYLLMSMVAVTTVASFEAVGSILVVAMLIVPGATAHLLTDRLAVMVWLAAALAALSAVLGTVVAYALDIEVAATMTVAAGLFYLTAVTLAPRYGLVSRLISNLQTAERILREDLLGVLYRLEELDVTRRLAPTEAIRAVGGGMLARVAMVVLLRSGRVARGAIGLELTPQGRDHASRLIRTHRLWETYLVDHLGLPLDHVHAPAERMEHFIDDRLRHELEEQLGARAKDPHGREIPE